MCLSCPKHTGPHPVSGGGMTVVNPGGTHGGGVHRGGTELISPGRHGRMPELQAGGPGHSSRNVSLHSEITAPGSGKSMCPICGGKHGGAMHGAGSQHGKYIGSLAKQGKKRFSGLGRRLQ